MLWRKDTARRTGTVSVERDSIVYTATYGLLPDGELELVQTGQRIRLRSLREEQAARILLLEAIWSGLADRERLGRPAPIRDEGGVGR